MMPCIVWGFGILGFGVFEGGVRVGVGVEEMKGMHSM